MNIRLSSSSLITACVIIHIHTYANYTETTVTPFPNFLQHSTDDAVVPIYRSSVASMLFKSPVRNVSVMRVEVIERMNCDGASACSNTYDLLGNSGQLHNGDGIAGFFIVAFADFLFAFPSGTRASSR